MSTHRLLMIEDDARLAAMVGEYLTQSGYAVTHTGDGEAGLEALRRDRFDLVVLDLMLPGIDGLEVCRRIRALPDGAARVPVLMLTAKGDPMDRIIGLELAPTTTCPSRSSRASCWRASAPCCAASSPARRPSTGCCASARWRSTATPAP